MARVASPGVGADEVAPLAGSKAAGNANACLEQGRTPRQRATPTDVGYRPTTHRDAILLADFLLTSLGIALLVGGGDATVRGAAALAARFGVSTLAIGLTVVAFGTSAPELAVNVIAAFRGQVELSFGNVFGSNIANIGLVIALIALARPLSIRNVIVSREMPMMMLATLAAITLALDALWGDGASRIGRGDGVLLLLLFLVFGGYTLNYLRRERDGGEMEFPDADYPPGQGAAPSVARTLAGLIGLAAGGALTVAGAEGLARAMGVSEAIIGLTLIAIGTSLPELVASIIASMRGHTDMAVGNVVGSNICNLLIVLGATASIHPVPVPEGGRLDLGMVIVFSLLFWVMSRNHRKHIVRTEAALLLALYITYLSARTFFSLT